MFKFLFVIFLIFPSCWVPVLAATDQLSPKTEVVKSHAETSSAPRISAKELEEIRDALEFQRGLKLEDKIIDRLTKRFTWIGLLVAVIGLFGITAITNLLVTPIINRTRDAASKANAEVEVASRTIAEMRSATMRAKEDADAVLKQANEQREIVSKITNELSQKAAELDKRFDSIQANAENIRDQLEQSFTALDERLTRLATEVPRAVDEQKALREASEAKLDEFKGNSGYTVHFAVYGNTDVPELPNLMEHFRNLGFKVTGSFDPNLDAGLPTNKNKATLTYTEKGEEKVRTVVDEIKTVVGIEIVPDSIPSAGDLVGDLQVGFQMGA